MDEKHTFSSIKVPKIYENSLKKREVNEERTSQSSEERMRRLCQASVGVHKTNTGLFTSNNDEGFLQIHANLNSLYKDRADDLSAMEAYETFERFVRPHGMLFPDFLREFEELKKRIESHGIILPQTVLACRMLRSANLSKERVNYVKDRITESTETAMSALLRKIMRRAPPQVPKSQVVIPGAKNSDERNNSTPENNNDDERKKKTDIVSVSGKEKEDKNILVNAESRRNQLMRDMAQLRLQKRTHIDTNVSDYDLQNRLEMTEAVYDLKAAIKVDDTEHTKGEVTVKAEVSQLEGSLEIDQPIFPPYLVAHTSVLCDALPSLKQLTQTARCIVIIPQAVIDILDFLKKSTAKAREAIRWLELEFRHGNRYIRAQKCNERLSGAGDSSLKKTNKDLWCLVEIVDCCRYLAQQSGEFSHSGVTTVLISNDPSTWDGAHFIKDMQQKGQCQDISFENINHFMNKWKVMWKSKG